ncbi:hypothetical protein [Endozoicomonas elysicola]|nr:hypothetical protein [Endozoicomonas elysicola]
MKKPLILLSGVLMSAGVLAVGALPPKYQNINDVKAMLEVVESNDLMASGLQSINLDEYVVYFRDECRAFFRRESSREGQPHGSLGPVAPLVLDHIECGPQTP